MKKTKQALDWFKKCLQSDMPASVDDLTDKEDIEAYNNINEITTSLEKYIALEEYIAMGTPLFYEPAPEPDLSNLKSGDIVPIAGTVTQIYPEDMQRKAKLFDKLCGLYKQYHKTKGKENLKVCFEIAKIYSKEKAFKEPTHLNTSNPHKKRKA